MGENLTKEDVAEPKRALQRPSVGEDYHPSTRMNTVERAATRGLLATDLVILNHVQVTWTTPELAPLSPNYHTTRHQREEVSALDRFNVHRCPTRRVFSGTGLELTIRGTVQSWFDEHEDEVKYLRRPALSFDLNIIEPYGIFQSVQYGIDILHRHLFPNFFSICIKIGAIFL
ncbi:uncharacterized protein TNCV_1333691 [Trichonephila clavipes]|nr:uncharacterized protein TNCV_1333691 [Trichonephila clavipes]